MKPNKCYFKCSTGWSSKLDINIKDWVLTAVPKTPALTWIRDHYMVYPDVFFMLMTSGNPDKTFNSAKTMVHYDTSGNGLVFDHLLNDYTFTVPRVGARRLRTSDIKKFVEHSKIYIYTILSEEIQKDGKYIIIKNICNAADVPQDVINEITLSYIHIYFNTH